MAFVVVFWGLYAGILSRDASFLYSFYPQILRRSRTPSPQRRLCSGGCGCGRLSASLRCSLWQLVSTLLSIHPYHLHIKLTSLRLHILQVNLGTRIGTNYLNIYNQQQQPVFYCLWVCLWWRKLTDLNNVPSSRKQQDAVFFTSI